MATLVIKKPTVGNFFINDVGVEIPGVGQETFSGDEHLIRDLLMSRDTRNAVAAGTLVVNNGVQDLSAYDGLMYLNDLWILIGVGFGIGDGLFPYQPRRGRRQWAIQQNDGLTTLNSSGFASVPTQNGTPGSVNAADGTQWVNYASSGAMNSDAGWLSSSFNQVRRENRPTWLMLIRSGAGAADITSVRIWAGLFSATPMASATPAATHMAAFRYDTGADGTAFWRCVTSGGAGLTTTVTTVGITPDTSYELIIDMSDPANVKFYINGVLVATHTTDLPGITQALGHVEQLRSIVAASRNWKNSRVHMEHS